MRSRGTWYLVKTLTVDTDTNTVVSNKDTLKHTLVNPEYASSGTLTAE